MQDYIDIANKNGVILLNRGSCQFCGAETKRGIHECIEIFSLGFQLIDYSKPENHIYRFLSVDAHTLQHPEIHGRWNNHFHLTRQHLMFHYQIQWNYSFSPKLSNYLNLYKAGKSEEYLVPPKIFARGNITVTDLINKAANESDCQEMIKRWGMEVYNSWSRHHETVDGIADEFIKILPSLSQKAAIPRQGETDKKQII
ncbi:DUF5946 family protein [Desertivirga brevis]|uniref:DUF5946 family protein n=1 Tax=Desertivirga brevis TaxID=2810310 RepID=UPI001A959046|nr:DUF5946 family protein [Pedobacter sp. SYSU D00873]